MIRTTTQSRLSVGARWARPTASSTWCCRGSTSAGADYLRRARSNFVTDQFEPWLDDALNWSKSLSVKLARGKKNKKTRKIVSGVPVRLEHGEEHQVAYTLCLAGKPSR